MADWGRQQGRTWARALTWPRGVAATAAVRWPWLADTGEAFRARLNALIAAEAAQAQLLPWLAIAFGVGIALYFTADNEPSMPAAVAVALLLGGGAIAARRHRAFVPAILLAVVASGFAVPVLKAMHVAHPVLERPLSGVRLAGFVETREERERSDRFVLRVERFETPRAGPTMERVRLSVRKGTAPEVGSFVALTARLTPPLAPLRPGGYDFARDLYFQGIGASGFVLGRIHDESPPVAAGWALRYAAAMQAMRDGIDARIRAQLSGDARAIATALLTGRRDAITTPVNDAMFVSGLGHILSISGYHMAVVAGVVFFAVRGLLALVPALTATFPIKKWAACAALLAATFYLLLSGAEVATRRSYLMTAVVLLAVMVDRRAVTVRTLAVAALVVLALAPEALVHPSFQMSFAATLGLVTLVQFGMPRLFASPDNSLAARAALWGGREIAVLLLASLVAGLATMPFAAYHFHRLAPYGLLANLAAMPVVSGVVMPAGLLGLAAIPFGFDGFFWWLMNLGIGWMIAVAQWVAALPGAVGRVPAFGTGALLLMTAGIVLLGLLRTPLRWIGAVSVAGGVAVAVLTPQPDVLIAGDGTAVAVRGRDGRFSLMRTGGDTFVAREWLAADADARGADDPSLTSGVSCDELGCVAPDAKGRLVALSLHPSAFVDDCARTHLIVTTGQPPGDCAALAFDRERLDREGAVALHAEGESYRVTAARPSSARRPWTGTARDIVIAPRNPDATPADTVREADD